MCLPYACSHLSITRDQLINSTSLAMDNVSEEIKCQHTKAHEVF